jgi:ABC-type lipoprotein export system ATPase subunit
MSILTKQAASAMHEGGADAPLIALRNVEKAYKVGSGVNYVLRRVSLDIAPGEFVTVMGPSGAGKSTLLAILGMFDAGFTGEYYFRGHPVHALDRFNIVGKKDLYPRQLSGGQQQLVGIARAVIAEPSLILADEPTGNLHSAQAREIMELFARLNAAGTTIVQVTHSDENARYGHRTIHLRDGWMEP